MKPIKSLPKSGKTIALTFDDGIVPVIHEQMLDILKQEQVPATFFLIGNNTNEKQLITRAIKEGHEIGNHSMSHPVLPSLSDTQIFEEIQGFQTIMQKQYNYQTRVFRAPKLRYDTRVMRVLTELNLVPVNATVGTKDYAAETTREYILKTATQSPKLTDGSIILLHEVQKTADVLPAIIKYYKQAGYTFMTVSQMLASESY
ncbi:polysaccharide deacetylase family protein [Paraglaciecola aquimarina]|uniref:Polysaccharide deacetylase family protein n=1 Tax=Paraglaciecola aquimarina TaxID=1235557 RepID=A0ABU3T0X3_9ALTE|nr:polysaccharide deacetylase family protein [Paraglaciecola aquimarina]MDU0355919.1 polysaccharide deacetylase family protein [Paraglaciecola aquimarina]